MEPSAVVDSSLYYSIIAFTVSLLSCALFSYLETSIAALRLFKLKELSNNTDSYRALFNALENTPNRVLIAILIAYNLSSVTAAAISSNIMDKIAIVLHMPEQLSFTIGIIITTATILVADLIPKSIATQTGSRLFASTLWMTNITYYFFYPFVIFLSRFTDAATSVITSRYSDGEEWVTSEKEIRFLIDYINEKGLMEHQKTAMLKSIFELSTTTIEEVMVPEISVISMNANLSLKDALEVFGKHPFTRIPIYEDNPENVIGMVILKDVFLVALRNEEKTLKDIMRPIMFMPESTIVLRALKEFREQRMHIAMVINEFGGIAGIVTLEDVIEEIVGDISDEHETVSEKIVLLNLGSWIIDASIELEELSALLGIEFSTKALTLGGFLIEQLQHMPKKGERLFYKKYYFQIQQSSPKRISQVLVFEDKPDQINQ